MRTNALLFALLLPPFLLKAQDSAQSTILERLSALEEQNRELKEEIQQLRQEVAAARTPAQVQTAAQPAVSQPTLAERVAVNERRIDEQSQTKVEAAHKFPLTLTGTLLFNAFSNSLPTGPPAAQPYQDVVSGPSNDGATLRQTMLGIQFQGPALPGGGEVHGNLMMDFFGGSSSSPQANWLRIRTGQLSLDWDRRSFSVGLDAPLISPHAPNSLAEVGIPPLSGSGNLWLWLLQARYEERIRLGQDSGIKAQVAVLQTNETYGSIPNEYTATLEASRPAIEGRAAFWHKFDDKRRMEFGAGFHASETHVEGVSIPSRVASLDWLVTPWSKLEFSGTVFHGSNFANLGGLTRGFTIFEGGAYETIRAIHGDGGWAQISSPLTSRLTLNVFSGLQSNKGADSIAGDYVRDFSYAANLMYRIAPNVIVSVEALQVRMRLLAEGGQTRNRYDLAIAYMF